MNQKDFIFKAVLIVTVVIVVTGFFYLQSRETEIEPLPSSELVVYDSEIESWKIISGSDFEFKYPRNFYGLEEFPEIKPYLNNSFVFFLSQEEAEKSRDCSSSQTIERSVSTQNESLIEYEFKSYSSCVDGAVLFITNGVSEEVRTMERDGLKRNYTDAHNRQWNIYEALAESNYKPVYRSLAVYNDTVVSIVTRKEFEDKVNSSLQNGIKLNESDISTQHQQLVDLIITTYK